jgi:hypothetical protein
MEETIYTGITAETLQTARERALNYLNLITGGEAEAAIVCVKEYLELDKILKEHEERERQLAEQREREQIEEIEF